MVYNGLTMKAGDFGSNRYISIAMVGLIEIPADVAALYFMDRFVSHSDCQWMRCVALVKFTSQSSFVLLIDFMFVSMPYTKLKNEFWLCSEPDRFRPKMEVHFLVIYANMNMLHIIAAIKICC